MEISDFFTSRQQGILEALRPVMEQRVEFTDPYGNEKTINIFRNVSAANLVQLLATSKMKQVRGLVNGRDIWFWDSFYGTHQEAAVALGIEYHLENRIHVWLDGNGDTCLDFLDRPIGDYPDVFAMKRLLTSPEIYFDGRSAGYVPGPEMIQLMAA